MYKAVKPLKDDSGHWYIVPNEESDLFYELLEKAENGDHEAEQLFIETFDGYMTGGDLNLKQLYIKYPEE